MRIGILTGGGDVPGLNPCIKAAVYRATDEGNEMVGIRRGWGGLLNFNPDDKRSHDEHIIPLTKANTTAESLRAPRTNCDASVRSAKIPSLVSKGAGASAQRRFIGRRERCCSFRDGAPRTAISYF